MQVKANCTKDLVHIDFGNGDKAQYPFLWLRDSAPESFHCDTLERTFDVLSVPLDIAPKEVQVQQEKLIIHWEDNHKSEFLLDWLYSFSKNAGVLDPADIDHMHWYADMVQEIPRVDGKKLLESDEALYTWLCACKRWGLSIVENVGDNADIGAAIAKRVGFLRETNFGVRFEVQSKPNPNNLAYTSESLPLHTDLPNQELPPGWQFLHCLVNNAEGGDSIFIDGIAVAEDFRQQHPDFFDVLSSVSIPFRFIDEQYDLRSRKKIINVDEKGKVYEICFSQHLADILDIPVARMYDFYRAYRAFIEKTRDPKYVMHYKLCSGEIAVFDNRAVLHGRSAFMPRTGNRHFCGYYVDRGEFNSRLRMLNKKYAK